MSPAAWVFAGLVAAGPFAGPRLEVVVEANGIAATEAARWRAACREVATRLDTPPGQWRVRLRRAPSVEAFAARTGRARFEAAALVGQTIWLQPAPVFERIPAASGVRRHECAHLALRRAGVPPLPDALEEAVAVGVSGQAARLPAGRALDAEGLRRASATLAKPRTAEALQASLRDAVSTLWPRLRDLEPEALVARLRALAAAPDWATAALAEPPRSPPDE